MLKLVQGDNKLKTEKMSGKKLSVIKMFKKKQFQENGKGRTQIVWGLR